MQHDQRHTHLRGDPAHFPAGSAWRKLLERHRGSVPAPPPSIIEDNIAAFKADHAERLTASLHPDAHRILQGIEQRLGLPELPVYIVSGKQTRPTEAMITLRWGAIFITEDFLQPPLERFESILLHEIGHGFEDTRFKQSAGRAVEFLGKMTKASPDNLTFLACSCLYTAASMVHRGLRMASEFAADKFAIRHASDPSQMAGFLKDLFTREYRDSTRTAKSTSPFTPAAVTTEMAYFLDHALDHTHPPLSIRYVVAAREVSKELECRNLR